ncbi:MAG: pyridoxamine 5'-phosphate oxidase family protein [Pseudomonadota bacterium]
MEKIQRDDTEESYNKRLEKDFVGQLKARITKLSPEELKERIIKFIGDNVLCTLATCADNVPRSTIVRYRSKDLTIYISTEGGGKLKNIRENPQVSLSICGSYTGFLSVTGLQAWGKAEIISPKDTVRYQETRGLMRIADREDLKSADLKHIPDMYILKIDITRARYLSFPEGLLNQVFTAE